MRVALVHDWLTGMRGGERVLEQHVALYPEAEIHTLVHVPGSTSAVIEARPIHASPLSGLPAIGAHYRKLLPLFPWAASRLRPQDVDVVLSSSHAVAKGVRAPAGARHVSYCFTPMRYVWDQADAYLGTGWKRARLLAAGRVAAPLGPGDLRARPRGPLPRDLPRRRRPHRPPLRATRRRDLPARRHRSLRPCCGRG